MVIVKNKSAPFSSVSKDIEEKVGGYAGKLFVMSSRVDVFLEAFITSTQEKGNVVS
jgi:hypothetical protein